MLPSSLAKGEGSRVERIIEDYDIHIKCSSASVSLMGASRATISIASSKSRLYQQYEQ